MEKPKLKLSQLKLKSFVISVDGSKIIGAHSVTDTTGTSTPPNAVNTKCKMCHKDLF